MMKQLAPFRRLALLQVATLVLTTASARVAVAQQSPELATARLTRSELESLRAEAQRSSDPAVRARAGAIAERLRNGDFHPGDQIIVAVRAAESRVDTLVVDSDRGLDIPNVAQVSLAGVLRAELASRLDSAVAAYVRNARVEATPLMRVAVVGQVARPGFYAFTSNMPLADVVMAAGGPTADADLAKVEVRRGGKTLVTGAATRTMIEAGFTLDDAGIRPGDELYLSRRRTVSQANVMSWITAAVSVIALTATLAQ